MPSVGQNTFLRFVSRSSRIGTSISSSPSAGNLLTGVESSRLSVIGSGIDCAFVRFGSSTGSGTSASPVWRSGMPHSRGCLSRRSRSNTGNRSDESTGHSR